MDDRLTLVLKGENCNGIASKDPRRLFATGRQDYLKKLVDHPHDHEPVADYLYKTLSDTLSSADYLFKESRRKFSTATYPNTELGKSLKTIASLSFSEVNTRVYYVSLSSFNRHINEEAQQKRLFNELNEAVAAFVKDIKSCGRFNNLLLFTFSKFDRRVNQNASGGTDHGTANNMFFISGALQKKGLINALPDLTNLENNDLKFSVDFRDVYQMVLKNWLQSDARNILGSDFSTLNIV